MRLTPSGPDPVDRLDLLRHYLRLHIAAATGGIELFGRGAQQTDPDVRERVQSIRAELYPERDALRRIAKDVGADPPGVLETLAKVAEKIGRLKPNGQLLRRTPLTDLVDLEAMRDAVCSKIAGWDALAAAADGHRAIDSVEINALRDRGARQLAELQEMHARIAWTSLAPGPP